MNWGGYKRMINSRYNICAEALPPYFVSEGATTSDSLDKEYAINTLNGKEYMREVIKDRERPWLDRFGKWKLKKSKVESKSGGKE